MHKPYSKARHAAVKVAELPPQYYADLAAREKEHGSFVVLETKNMTKFNNFGQLWVDWTYEAETDMFLVRPLSGDALYTDEGKRVKSAVRSKLTYCFDAKTGLLMDEKHAGKARLFLRVPAWYTSDGLKQRALAEELDARRKEPQARLEAALDTAKKDLIGLLPWARIEARLPHDGLSALAENHPVFMASVLKDAQTGNFGRALISLLQLLEAKR